MIRALAANEIRAVIRDGRLPIAGFALLALLAAAIVSGHVRAEAAAQERVDAREAARSQWENQGDKNPHAAAHYGTQVFKPVGALESFDPGATPWLGVTLKIVAHRRQLASDAASADATALDRFVTLSPATVLQLLLPLVIIGLGFGVWTRERELGTLLQLSAQGVSPKDLFIGKTLGFLAVAGLVAVPAIVGTALSLGGQAPAGRVGGLIVAHLLWVLTWVGLTLAVSALAKSSRTALVGLLALWGLVGLVGPRMVQDISAATVPIEDRETFAESLATSLKQGIPGGPAREDRVDELTNAILEEAGFKDAATFMDEGLLGALELQAEAAFENEVIGHHFAQLEAGLDRRERVTRWLGFLSPYVAMRAVSAGLSGTDAAHHRHFAGAAETYRQGLVNQLNTVFAENAGDEGWDFKAGRELWEKAPPLKWEAPAVDDVFEAQMPALLALLVWCMAALGLGFWAVRRVRVH